MADNITHDDLMAALSEIGEAVGRALAAGLATAVPELGDARLSLLSDALRGMADDDRFSPEANLVMGGIAEGVDTFTDTDPNG